MSDKYLHNDGHEHPSQDWVGGAEFLRLGCNEQRQRCFEVIRDILEDAGIPFTRANELAERCYAALEGVI